MEIIRDPLWNNVRLDPLALRLVDTAPFQRLRWVRQLGLAFLVYPGATHARFEHAIGAYHLARRTTTLLGEKGELRDVPPEACALVHAAALLHDVGHYPFSHALEEIGAPHHEQVAHAIIASGEIARALGEALGPGAADEILALIAGRSESPLQRLISGSLDLDKIEYLKRDALMCGVPYGEVDEDRLINAMALVRDPATGRQAVGIEENGLSALESLLFARYQMYRNVYWHHAVRSATAMYKRVVGDALAAGALDGAALAAFTDEGILLHLERAHPSPLLARLRSRRLHKRALQCPAAELPADSLEWIAKDPALATRVEDRMARDLGLAPGELLLDFPQKTQMLGLDVPVRRRGGDVRRLTSAGLEGAINLTRLSEELYHTARWLRVFTVERRELPVDAVLAILTRPGDELASLVESDSRLL